MKSITEENKELKDVINDLTLSLELWIDGYPFDDNHKSKQKKLIDNTCLLIGKPRNIEELKIFIEKKPCEHLRYSDCQFWCNGIEFFWQDCCKYYKNRRYKVDEYCHDTNLTEELWKKEMERKTLEQPISFGC